ncbi:hypothetical protein MMC25_001808 [Agyrium rufum]|nr:hypothetical protein [Agyrium rufum]
MADISGTLGSTRNTVIDLLASNHTDHAILHNRVLHNHIPHLIASIALLGGTQAQLIEGYRHESEENEAWSATSPPTSLKFEDAVAPFLGDTSYQKGFLDFFDAELIRYKGDWKALLSAYLLGGSTPMLSGLVGGFGHPLILLADAVELQSSEVAVEALALTAADWNDFHKVVSLVPTPSGVSKAKRPQEIIDSITKDSRFDQLCLRTPGVPNTKTIISNTASREAVMEYLFILDTSDRQSLLSELAELAVLFECCGQKPGEPAYDFYLNHALTFVYSLHVLLPEYGTVDSNALVLIRCVWLLMILSYVTQLRPILQRGLVEEYQVPEGMRLQDVLSEITNGEILQSKFLDPHFLRAVRNLMELGAWDLKQEDFYLRAAVKLKTEWTGWTGLGKVDEAYMNVRL